MSSTPRDSYSRSPRPSARRPGSGRAFQSSIVLAHGGDSVLSAMSQESPRKPSKRVYHSPRTTTLSPRGPQVAAGKRVLAKPGGDETSGRPATPQGKRVVAPPGGVESSGGFRLGVDKVPLESTARTEMAAPYMSPREPPAEVTPRKRDPRRPLVKPLKGVGGDTTVTLGTDSVTYRESLKEAELSTARRASVRARAAASDVAGTSSSTIKARAGRPLTKPKYGPGGKDSVPLGDPGTGMEKCTTARERARDVTREELRRKAADQIVAGQRVERTTPRGLRTNIGGHQTFSISDSSYLEEKPSRPASPAHTRRAMVAGGRPQPVGGIPLKDRIDPGYTAGSPAHSINKHRSIRVTQNVGGNTSIRLG